MSTKHQDKKRRGKKVRKFSRIAIVTKFLMKKIFIVRDSDECCKSKIFTEAFKRPQTMCDDAC